MNYEAKNCQTLGAATIGGLGQDFANGSNGTTNGSTSTSVPDGIDALARTLGEAENYASDKSDPTTVDESELERRVESHMTPQLARFLVTQEGADYIGPKIFDRAFEVSRFGGWGGNQDDWEPLKKQYSIENANRFASWATTWVGDYAAWYIRNKVQGGSPPGTTPSGPGGSGGGGGFAAGGGWVQNLLLAGAIGGVGYFLYDRFA